MSYNFANYFLLIFIILIFIYGIFDDEDIKEGIKGKCLKGCIVDANSPNCGKFPCKKNECPFYCASRKMNNPEWCAESIFTGFGRSRKDCSECGCAEKPN